MSERMETVAKELGCWRLAAIGDPLIRSLQERTRALGGTWLRLFEGRPVSCPDIRAIVSASDAPLVVDVTAVTLRGCDAVRKGAAVALELLPDGGALVAVSRNPGPLTAYLNDELELEGREAGDSMLASLEERWRASRASSDEAQVVASYLACHPLVSRVAYPGLKGGSSFEVAARTLVGGFGPVVDFELRGKPGDWQRLRCVGGDPRATIMGLERSLRSG